MLAFNSVVRSRFPGSTHFIARPDALVGLVAALVCSAKDITALKVLIEPASRENVAPVEMERLASAHRVGTRFPRLSEGYGQGGTVWLDAERGTITQETRDEQRGIYWLISADPSTLREWRLALR